ncbi:MAG: vanillate O-demethylase oxidoreductase VanB [Acidobacteria bacterium]|nr:MAG: vanillate O-demethylase oxidoreductase VanB [Acidobacteriota bacterium]
MSMITTDRIEKKIQLRHPRSKVWRALTDAQEFGSWFGAVFTEPFKPGVRLRGKVTHKGYEHMTMDVTIERMEPERLFSWRWHPGAAQPGEDFSDEPTTLVVFELQDVPGGTLLTVVESGFDQIPLARRAKAFRMNDEGWAMQMKAIEGYLARSS